MHMDYQRVIFFAALSIMIEIKVDVEWLE
jgi:hypothetical protein